MFLSLQEVKKHLNIDEFFHDDDEYLNHLVLVAEKVVEKHIDRDFNTLMNGLGELPPPILHSMLLFIGDMYQSRESISFASAQELPNSFKYLLGLYQDYSSDMSIKPDMPRKEVVIQPDHSHDEEPPKKEPCSAETTITNIEVIDNESGVI